MNKDVATIDDVILNKCASIERCIQRIQEEYQGYEEQLTINYTKQDSILLNIQRACETSINLGMYIIRKLSLGIPQSCDDIFEKLAEVGKISPQLCKKLQAMVGFRNIAVHEYQKLNIDIVRSIIEERLNDFIDFTKAILSESH